MDSLRVTLLALGLAAVAAPVAADPAPKSDSVGCASVSASARLQAYGYAHVVTLANHCSRPVMCEVWTDVDPTPHYTVTAKAGETVETVTRAGSPSRAVQAGKSCHLAG